LGDIAADVVLDVALGFGIGFLARKFFGWIFGGDNEIQRLPEKVIDKDALAERMKQAAHHIEALGQNYVALPAPTGA
jgi:hypothetical protein